MKFNVNGKEVNIIIGENILNMIDQNKRYFIVYQHSVKNFLPSLLPNLRKFDLFEVPDGESAKEIDVALKAIKYMKENEFNKGDFVISFGGGAVSDLAGFIASIYMRGIGLINIPTTLLSMVDASLGGKNGVNFESVKNVIGTFYQPYLILDNIEFLRSLPKEEILSGLGEVVKYSIILDKDLYDFLLNNKEKILNLNKEEIVRIIESSVKDKMDIVSKDETESKGLRFVLNFGHTIGHAIESGSRFRIKHGLAISYGMLCETEIGVNKGLVNDKVYDSLKYILDLYELKINKNLIDIELALSSLKNDKKIRDNKIMIPIPVDIGKYQIIPMEMSDVEKGLIACLN